MRQLFRFAARRVGREFSSFCGRGWARLSCNLQRCVSQMILARTEGASFAPVVDAPARAPPPAPLVVPSFVPPSVALVAPLPAATLSTPIPAPAQVQFVPVVNLLALEPTSRPSPSACTSRPSPSPCPVTPLRPPEALPYWMPSPPVDLPLCLATPPVKRSVLGATRCLTRGCPHLTFSACGFCDEPEAPCWRSHPCSLPQHRAPSLEIPPFPGSLKGVCVLSGRKEGKESKDAHTAEMHPKQLSTASPAAHGLGFSFAPPPPSLPAPPSHALHYSPVPRVPQVDLGSSSFGHTGFSPYLFRRGGGGGWEGVLS